MTSLERAGSLPDDEGVLVEIDSTAGPLEIRFTYEDARRLIAALQPMVPEKAQPVLRWETAIDPVNQDAVILARVPDQTTQETRISRTDLPAIARFLDQARRRFDGSADLRQ